MWAQQYKSQINILQWKEADLEEDTRLNMFSLSSAEFVLFLLEEDKLCSQAAKLCLVFQRK